LYFILNSGNIEAKVEKGWIKTHQAGTENPDLMNQNQILYNDGVTILVTHPLAYVSKNVATSTGKEAIGMPKFILS